MRESMPLLLTESLDPGRRELTHQHIEGCAECEAEWDAFKETWMVLGDLPEVEVPPQLKQRFLAAAGIPEVRHDNVVPFTRRPAFKWVAQAAAVAVLVGGGWFAGNRTAPRVEPTPARVTGMAVDRMPVQSDIVPVSLSETRVLDATNLSPQIEGRPDISNVRFTDSDTSDDRIGVEFDITSRYTVTGSPKDRSMVRLLSYVLENETSMDTPRSNAIEWVRRTYSDAKYADAEIAGALAKVLRNDTHEGVRIRAVDTLKTLPPTMATESRDALIEALKSDPNPAVRIKAIEALGQMASRGSLDAEAIDMLRQKAAQNDENTYVRVKAAEALSNVRP
jgi:hypothetical protein